MQDNNDGQQTSVKWQMHKGWGTATEQGDNKDEHQLGMMTMTPGSHNRDNNNNDNENSSPLPHLKCEMEGAIIFPCCINQPSPAPTSSLTSHCSWGSFFFFFSFLGDSNNPPPMMDMTPTSSLVSYCLQVVSFFSFFFLFFLLYQM